MTNLNEIFAAIGFCTGIGVLLNTIYELYVGKNSMPRSGGMAFLSGVLIGWSFYLLH